MKYLLTIALLLLSTIAFAQKPDPFDELISLMKSSEFAAEVACSTLDDKRLDSFCDDVANGRKVTPKKGNLAERMIRSIEDIRRRVRTNEVNIAVLQSNGHTVAPSRTTPSTPTPKKYFREREGHPGR